MLRPGGQATIFGGGGTFAKYAPNAAPTLLTCDEVTCDTWQCIHCGGQQHAPIRKRDTEYFFCRNCMGRICDTCADHPCVHFMKKIEMAEAKSYALRTYGV